MRVISQNNQIDVPYEMTAFHVSDNIIRMNMIGDTGKGSIMAVYSTSEKAEKSMLLLRKIYVKAPLENDAKEMREFVRGTFKAIGTSGYVEPESNYFVFRFPQEDEI